MRMADPLRRHLVLIPLLLATLAEARQRIIENPMIQTHIRQSLGADYLLDGSVIRARAPN